MQLSDEQVCNVVCPDITSYERVFCRRMLQVNCKKAEGHVCIAQAEHEATLKAVGRKLHARATDFEEGGKVIILIDREALIALLRGEMPT